MASASLATKVAIGVGGAYVAYKVLDSKIQLSHDFKMARRLAPVRSAIAAKAKSGYNTATLFRDTLAKYGNKEALVFDNASFTFKELDIASNRVANWALATGLTRGDRVALVMENRPEYVITWLGLTKVGVEIALINYNLVGRGLMHCITVSNAKVVVFGTEVAQNVGTVAADLAARGVALYYEGQGVAPFGEALNPLLDASSAEGVSPALVKDVGMDDTFGFIYTSGTTGLPKAAVIKHAKMFGFGALFCGAFQVTSADRIYCCLPLYHSAGGGCGVGMMLVGGATLVIRRKFSASRFWQEVAHFRCTVVQYIGELCRYLLQAPRSKYDRAHKTRIAIGNGLRPDIWAQFQERFNVPEIGEFYGATEGNTALVNHCTTKEAQGAVGRMGALLRKVTGVKLVKFDVEEEVPKRGSDGFCIECAAGESGEMLAPILPGKISTQFQGYTDPKATAKKVMTDVFVKGDKYFRTGDLLMRDSNGYYYFMDRIGDTFRWKGENVSTTEVAEVVSQFPGITEVNVYGVQIPGKDGRACMAACVFSDDLDLAKLAEYNSKNLPTYAQPLFLRQLPEIEVTGTFKHKKVALRKEGMNPSTVSDRLFWLNPSSRRFEHLDADAYNTIVSGRAKL